MLATVKGVVVATSKALKHIFPRAKEEQQPAATRDGTA
jgi:hypothetical protein